jgi:hypothetical protein
MRSLLATIDHDDPMLTKPAEVFSVQKFDVLLDTLTQHSPADAPWMAHVTRANGDTAGETQQVKHRVGPAQRINPTTQDLRIAVIHGLRRSFLQVKYTL